MLSVSHSSRLHVGRVVVCNKLIIRKSENTLYILFLWQAQYVELDVPCIRKKMNSLNKMLAVYPSVIEERICNKSLSGCTVLWVLCQ